MAGMPDAVEDRNSRGGAAKFFKYIEGWLNAADPVTRSDRRTRARASVGGFGGISPTTTLSGGQSAGGMSHFDQHWRGGSSGWWPNIPAATVNTQMGNAFAAALDPAYMDCDIRLRWDCSNRNLNAVNYFYANARPSGSEVWIEIVSPRAPGGIDPESDGGLPNFGFNAASNLPPGSLGPFTVLGDLEVANYDGAGGVDVSFDNALGQEITIEGFRESWSFFPIPEPVENGPQVLTGLSYTRDSWRPVADREGAFEDDHLHSETGYLLWDERNGLAYRVVALPRGVTLLAVARDVGADSTKLEFVAEADSTDGRLGGILSNPIISGTARTRRFTSTMEIVGAGDAFAYEDSSEQVRGEKSDEIFRHVDRNHLRRV